MSFILFFALYVLAALMLISLFKVVFTGANSKELDQYFNLADDQTKAIQPIKYCAFAYLFFAVVSLVFSGAVVIAQSIFIVEACLAWFWLYETYNAGKLQIWFDDLKKDKA